MIILTKLSIDLECPHSCWQVTTMSIRPRDPRDVIPLDSCT